MDKAFQIDFTLAVMTLKIYNFRFGRNDWISMLYNWPFQANNRDFE